MSTKIPSIFTRIAKGSSRLMGRPLTFCIAVLLVLTWAISGPYFGYSDTWQLTINTGTTIVTFLMVFLIQATQNRDARVMQLKLDELIRAVEAARNELVDMEELSDAELERLQHEFARLHERAAAHHAKRRAQR